MSRKIENALGLYMEGIRDGHPHEALEKYIGTRYTQHSTGVAHGKEGFLAFFQPFLDRTPERDIRVIRAIEDGPHVFCHVYQSLNGGAAQWVTMDLFDTDEDDRIIEHWDVISPWVEETRSGEDMISGPDKPEQQDKTDSNKSVVKEFVKRVLTEGHLDLLNDYVAEDLVQHVPDLESGRSALKAALEDGRAGQYDMLFKLIGEGNFVVTYGSMHQHGKDHAVFDIYRVEQGLIAEHWQAAEPILPRSEWGNSGKF